MRQGMAGRRRCIRIQSDSTTAAPQNRAHGDMTSPGGRDEFNERDRWAGPARHAAGGIDIGCRGTGRLFVRFRHGRDQRRGRCDPGQFRAECGRDRFCRVVRLAGLGAWRVVRRHARQPLRSGAHHAGGRGAAGCRRPGFGSGDGRMGPDRVAPGGRHRCRRGLGDRAHLYRRSGTCPHSRSARFDAAAGDRAGHLRGIVERCLAGRSPFAQWTLRRCCSS